MRGRARSGWCQIIKEDRPISHSEFDRLQVSKTLAYALRHRPQEFALQMDSAGWVDIQELLVALRQAGTPVTLADLQLLVDNDSKGRYSIRDGKIRANQGHSVKVNAVELVPVPAPDRLYHGTSTKHWTQIQSSGGLKPGQRHHVHLSHDTEVARQVATRWRDQQAMLLRVDAKGMQSDGMVFFQSENGVWLTDHVPLKYLAPDAQTDLP